MEYMLILVTCQYHGEFGVANDGTVHVSTSTCFTRIGGTMIATLAFIRLNSGVFDSVAAKALPEEVSEELNTLLL